MNEREPRDYDRLLPETRRVLHDVQECTGRPVEIRPEPRVRGRGRADYVVTERSRVRDLVLYDPQEGMYLDHLVAHECGHILRFSQAQPNEQTVPIMTIARRNDAISQLEPELIDLASRGFPALALIGAVNIWLSGTVAQLSDTPADIRIEEWLFHEYPGLREAQKSSLERQSRMLSLVLKPAVVELTPPSLWRASTSMNYALTKAVSRLFSEPSWMAAYRDAEVTALGDELLAMVDDLPGRGLASERGLSQQWAARLGVSEWLEWRTLDSLPADFRHAWE